MKVYFRIMGVRSLTVLATFAILTCLGCEATVNGTSADGPHAPMAEPQRTSTAENRQTIVDRQQTALTSMEAKARIRRTGAMRGHFKQDDTNLVVGLEPECQNLFSNKITICKEPAYGVPVYIKVLAQKGLVPVQIGVTDERGILNVNLDQAIVPNVVVLPTTGRLSCAPIGPGFVFDYEADGAPPGVCQKLSNEADLPPIDLRPINSVRDDRLWAQSNVAGCSNPTTSDACAGIQRYVSTFKGVGNHSDEANDVLRQAMPALTRLIDDQQWSAINVAGCHTFAGTDPDAATQACNPVADYLKSFPSGAHADQAREALAQGKRIRDQLVARAAATERQERAAEAARQGAADNKRRERCMGVCRIQCSDKLRFDECFAGCPAVCQ